MNAMLTTTRRPRTSLRLTDEERQLAADNIGLVRQTLRQPRMRLCVEYLGWDDALGEGGLGLVRAAALWDPTSGHAFAPFAVMSIEWTIRDTVRRQLAERRGRASRKCPANSETLAAPPTPQPSEPAVVDRLLVCLLPREREAVTRTILDGEMQLTLAAEWGVQPKAVSRIVQGALARLRRRVRR